MILFIVLLILFAPFLFWLGLAFLLDALLKGPSVRYSPSSRGPYYVAERLIALRRDGYTCQRCGSYPVYITHHVMPRKRGGSDHHDNLLTVCASCHPKIEPR